MSRYLEQSNYAAALPLFTEMDDQLAPLVVIESVSPGTIYVNDGQCPGSALLKVGHRYYLAGNPANAAFNQDLRDLFVQSIIPQTRAAGDGGFMMYVEDPGWYPVIEGIIFAGCKLYPGPRQYYKLDLHDPNWQVTAPALPEGFTFRPVDRALLADPRYTNLDELTEEMCSERESVEDFLSRSFGTVLVTADKIAGWCLSEYNLADRCEVGIATAEEHRQRGLATLSALTFIEQARAHGIRRIGWHCWTGNEGSVNTAKRLEFRLMKDLRGYFAAVKE